MKIEATFVTSAAGAADFPRQGFPEIALVGRSNVGKSSLINALVRQRLARTSAAPGKTRLANVYQAARGANAPVYLVDLPGYGYARGGQQAAAEFATLTRAFFGRATEERHQEEQQRHGPSAGIAALLVVDSRHPGLQSDLDAWEWLGAAVERHAVVATRIVATKIDKLSRAERQRASRQLEAVFEHPVLPVSAVTGEGLDQLWILIDKLTNSRSRKPPHSSNLPKATARPQPLKPPRR